NATITHVPTAIGSGAYTLMPPSLNSKLRIEVAASSFSSHRRSLTRISTFSRLYLRSAAELTRAPRPLQCSPHRPPHGPHRRTPPPQTSHTRPAQKTHPLLPQLPLRSWPRRWPCA